MHHAPSGPPLTARLAAAARRWLLGFRGLIRGRRRLVPLVLLAAAAGVLGIAAPVVSAASDGHTDQVALDASSSAASGQRAHRSGVVEMGVDGAPLPRSGRSSPRSSAPAGSPAGTAATDPGTTGGTPAPMAGEPAGGATPAVGSTTSTTSTTSGSTSSSAQPPASPVPTPPLPELPLPPLPPLQSERPSPTTSPSTDPAPETTDPAAPSTESPAPTDPGSTETPPIG